MHKWTTTQTAFVECDAVTSGLKGSDVSEEHGASIFSIPLGGHITVRLSETSVFHQTTRHRILENGS